MPLITSTDEVRKIDYIQVNIDFTMKMGYCINHRSEESEWQSHHRLPSR